MNLVADSGATKTRWRATGAGNSVSAYTTGGLSPFFRDSVSIAEEIGANLLPHVAAGSVQSVFFYGAGCSSPARCDVVSAALRQCFPSALLEVNHDLLGAARAVCGRKEGMAAILGTGSNSCCYDGTAITKNIPALGYVLGDEGSGAHLGKTLIKHMLEGAPPEELSKAFRDAFKTGKDEILDAVYRKPMPSRFLASFAPFLHAHRSHPWVAGLITGCFREFFDRRICRYADHKTLSLGCVGSVGYHFREELAAVAAEKGVQLGAVLQDPIDALAAWHES